MGTTLEAPTHTFADRIPLGRRIEELKKEKGGWYSTLAMSKRLGLSEVTFRQMLKSKRAIYTFELDKIAKDLKMSPERILQVDVQHETELLAGMLLSRKHPDKLLELALSLSDQAIGLTERCNSLLRLGQSLNYLSQFQESNVVLEQARHLAMKIKEDYGETDILYSVMFQLMATFTAIRDYSSASKLLNELTPFFVATPSRLSAISYQKAMIEESKGNIHEAQKFAVESVWHAEQSGNSILLAQTKFNLAHFEFKLTNYEKASELLEVATLELRHDKRTELLCQKEIVKAFLKQGMKERAKLVIEIALEKARSMGWTDMIGKLTILYTIATSQPCHAQSVLEDSENSLKIRYLACKCLLEHYVQAGDASMVLHYHEVAGKMCVDFSDFLHEGEL